MSKLRTDREPTYRTHFKDLGADAYLMALLGLGLLITVVYLLLRTNQV